MMFCKVCFTILLILTVLTSCAKQPVASETIAEGAISAATAIEQTLPKECATQAIKTQITALKTQIKAITAASESEKQVIEQEKIRWKWAFLSLVMAIALFIAKKVFV